ncbi:MAG: hypothetical protein O9301_15185 [Leptospira sp.]|nr:hypothetical protein [Leptospira sp.]
MKSWFVRLFQSSLFPLLILWIGISDSFPNSTSAEESVKFTGLISSSEKRIWEAKQMYGQTGIFPTEWKLFFKAKQGDYVVFYDLNGDEIHFRYRRNKFDLDAEEFVKDLFFGNPYRVLGEWTGYYFYQKDERGKRSPLAIPKKNPAVKEEFLDRQTIPIFKLLEYSEIRTDEVLF